MLLVLNACAVTEAEAAGGGKEVLWEVDDEALFTLSESLWRPVSTLFSGPISQ